MKRYGERRRLPPRGPLREIVRTEIDEFGYGGTDVLECGHTKLRTSLDAGIYKRRCEDCRRASPVSARGRSFQTPSDETER